jgi:hypothetical protein
LNQRPDACCGKQDRSLATLGGLDAALRITLRRREERSHAMAAAFMAAYHGGNLLLEKRASGGLHATLALPKDL